MVDDSSPKTFEVPPGGADATGLEDYGVELRGGERIGTIVGSVEEGGRRWLVVETGLPPFKRDRRAIPWSEIEHVDHDALLVTVAPPTAETFPRLPGGRARRRHNGAARDRESGCAEVRADRGRGRADRPEHASLRSSRLVRARPAHAARDRCSSQPARGSRARMGRLSDPCRPLARRWRSRLSAVARPLRTRTLNGAGRMARAAERRRRGGACGWAAAVVERGRQLAPAAAVDTLPDLPGVADRDAPASVAELERLG